MGDRMGAEGPPRVSVLMPAHNAARWLGEAIESVLGQTLADLELLVVDDGSTDGSAEILRAFQQRDPRLKVLVQPRRGLCDALNHGLAAARAPLLARLDADDLAHPERLERQAAFLAAQPQTGLVGAWAQEIDDGGRVVGQRRPETDPHALSLLLAHCNPFIHSSVMARTELLRRLGGYRCVFEAAEDYDLWLRVAEAAEVVNLPEALVSYRVHDGGVSKRDGLRQAFSVRLARKAAEVRRLEGRDPADVLTCPPDWRRQGPADAFYAEDAALYRWLELAEGRPIYEAAARPSGSQILDRLSDLSHAERRLAAMALVAQMKSSDPAEARDANSLLLRLCWENPSTVLKAAWSMRRRGPRQAAARGL
ncbi:MAG: glycosyltransferase [Caulobacteraceae bacterium]|nr:glycosyltransferase [Caulobacteraceae bacterium]